MKAKDALLATNITPDIKADSFCQAVHHGVELSLYSQDVESSTPMRDCNSSRIVLINGKACALLAQAFTKTSFITKLQPIK